VLIATVGSILPILIGIVISTILYTTDDMIRNVAAGATFGPTSLGIGTSMRNALPNFS
jgi:putative effector of murein hydrolase